MSLPSLDEGTLDELYTWLDAVPFSRPRKNLAKDFSDGVLIAELIAHFLPRYVDLNNYPPASSTVLKKYNFETLNKKVFTYLNYSLSNHHINQVACMRPGAIEFVLCQLRPKIDLAISQNRFKPRKTRSRSSSRAGSTLSLASNSDDCMSLSFSTNSADNGKQQNFKSLPKFNVSRSGSRSARDPRCEDLAPASLLHRAQQEVLAKDAEVQTLMTRVRHLERVIQLKDERIEQLTIRLDRLAQIVYHTQGSTPESTPKTPKSPSRPWRQQPPANQQQQQLPDLSKLLAKMLGDVANVGIGNDQSQIPIRSLPNSPKRVQNMQQNGGQQSISGSSCASPPRRDSSDDKLSPT